MEELKPCPFCGGSAGHSMGLHHFYDVVVSCDDCSAEGPVFDVDDHAPEMLARNMKAAYDHWNGRA